MTRTLVIIVLVFSFLQSGCISHQQQLNQQLLTSSVNLYQSAAEKRLQPYFQRANVTYPSQQIALLVFKQEKRLELWAKNDNGAWAHIKTYPIKAASGGPGPKLREGDNQVPEGIYRVICLNPHSHFHLSMALSYPNAFDLEHAKKDGRRHPGNNIYIHGKAVSRGCVAVGDTAIEELFVLVYKAGLDNVEVFIAPNDIRHAPPAKSKQYPGPRWLPALYQNIKTSLTQFNKNFL